MRLLICAGGTGGGVYPALAVLQALQAELLPSREFTPAGSIPPSKSEEAADGRDDVATGLPRLEQASFQSRALSPQLSVLWVGGIGGMEADLVKRAGLPFEAISAAGVHGVGVRTLPGNLLKLSRGYRQSKHILSEFRPDVLFFTGGYVAVPMAMAARKVPIVLFVPDIEPGLALKTLARFASRIAVPVEESRAYFHSHPGVMVTGYPVRAELQAWNVSAARQSLNISPDLPVFLVMGGSKGARSINQALLAVLPALLAEMQVIHISGQLDWPAVEAARVALAADHPQLAGRYQAFPYLHDELGAALSVADLVLSRAGASVLGELPLFGLPAILVPYPYAWRYQQVNAQYLVQRGAARIVADADLSNHLLPAVLELMRDRTVREKMRQGMRSLACPDAAKSISHLLQSLAGEQAREGCEA